MTQAQSIGRKSKSDTAAARSKGARKPRVVYAYVSGEASVHLLKTASARLPRGLKVAIVSDKPLDMSKIDHVLPTVEEMQLYERPEGDAPASVGVKPEAYEPDVRARALLRGVKLVEEDLKVSGGAYSLEQVQELLRGVTRQAINNRVRNGSLLAVAGPSNRTVYPVVQFTSEGAPVGGLKALREALKTQSGWMLLNFLVHPEPRLDGKKPIDLLKAGQVERVVEAAQHIGVQGA